MSDQINKYFKWSEFACKCKRCEYSSGRDIDPRIPEVMLEIRLRLMRPITISSGCRCDFHNAMVGGSRNSQHKAAQGFKACDFLVTSAIERYMAVEICIKHGVSFGFTKGFMHIDVRGTPMAFTY